MKKKELESLLSQIRTFSEPIRTLEQYHTPWNVASQFLKIIEEHFNLEDRTVLDLGAGTGILSLGALFCGSSHVTGIEICPEALKIFDENIDNFGVEDEMIDTIERNIFEALEDLEFIEKLRQREFDLVMMNPPFGCSQNENIDKRFIEFAWQVTDGPIFVIHKSSRVPGLEKFCQTNGKKCEELKKVSFGIENKKFEEKDFKSFKKNNYKNKKKSKCKN